MNIQTIFNKLDSFNLTEEDIEIFSEKTSLSRGSYQNMSTFI